MPWVLATENEDIRSLRQLITYGVKGMAAYAKHAYVLGYENKEIMGFMQKALAATLDDTLGVQELVVNHGNRKYGVDVMALLDQANTAPMVIEIIRSISEYGIIREFSSAAMT